MIETEEAVANADAICATPGLTGIYIGPSDIAITMGKGPGIDPTDPAVVANIEKAPAAAKKAGIKAGIHRSEEHTSELQSLMRNSYDVFCLNKNTSTVSRVNHNNN